MPPASSHKINVSIEHTSATQHAPSGEHGSSAHKVPTPIKTPLKSMHFCSGTSTHTSVIQQEPTSQGDAKQSIPIPRNVPPVVLQSSSITNVQVSPLQQAPDVLAHGSPSHVVALP